MISCVCALLPRRVRKKYWLADYIESNKTRKHANWWPFRDVELTNERISRSFNTRLSPSCMHNELLRVWVSGARASIWSAMNIWLRESRRRVMQSGLRPVPPTSKGQYLVKDHLRKKLYSFCIVLLRNLKLTIGYISNLLLVGRIDGKS